MSMIQGFRPFLAVDAPWDHYKALFDTGYTLPLYASYKLDGIRCIIMDGRPFSRTLKPIRNDYISSLLSHADLEGLDGELVVGDASGEGVFARTSSGVMSYSGRPNFTYWVFDDLSTLVAPFSIRSESLLKRIINLEDTNYPFIRYLQQFPVWTLEELERLEQQAVDEGYEGLIVRTPTSPYKFGRSTLRESYLMKLKRFLDSEATIVGFQEKMINANDPSIDSRGYQVRGSSKEGKIPANTLGALLVRDLHKPEWQFNVGSGFDDALRHQIWNHQDEWLSRIIKYKFLPVGTLEQPRHPIYLGLRDLEDVTTPA